MLLTGCTFLLIGLIAMVKTLAPDRRPVVGAGPAPLVMIASAVFMHNVANTPAYATLTAFGVSELFVYFFVRGAVNQSARAQLLAGRRRIIDRGHGSRRRPRAARGLLRF